MDIKPLETDTDYRAALRGIETLMGAELDTPEGERLDVLVTLVEAYESREQEPGHSGIPCIMQDAADRGGPEVRSR